MRKRRSAFDFAADSMVAGTSAAMTLWHRLPMLGIASFATTAERQAEATRMVDEKTAAFIEGCVGASMEAYRAFNTAAMGEFGALMNAPIAIANAGLKPAFRRVNANAKRLNRRAARNAVGS